MLEMLSIIGVAIAFVLIIVLIGKEVKLGYAMLWGSVVIAITSQIDLAGLLAIIGTGVLSGDTLELIVIVVLIGVLARFMKETDLLSELIESYSYILGSQRVTAAFIPSIMGALPIPGGAIMSAPMVESVGDNIKLSAREQMSVNLLYRHIWLFVFPITPPLLLTASLSQLGVFTLIKMQFPITIVMGAVGYYFLLSKYRHSEVPSTTELPKQELSKVLKKLLVSTLPLLISLGLPLLTGLSFVISLLIALLLIVIIRYQQFNLSLLTSSFNYELTLAIVGIMVFQEFVNQGPDLELLTGFLLNLGLPITFLVVLMPALIAYVTGNTTAAIGITFPLLLPLVGYDSTMVMLMYGAAFFAYFLSPLHFCLILTKEYFGTRISSIYRELFWPWVVGVFTLVVLVIIY
ncbi:DUF401 family protein [Fuchsiella alkaliacetigena]|uniref:DUF401 family protein n=1 Tax=Fuchsiella alkaliacetigena TaxID=957042 RepID=UPI00200AE16D|nr:DUF401 family protein [Fuchsiella alkaliacetigena]MCK8826078.1 DUF401 family protein [Fuchsiella alkaliacetigena]